jgi:hypothetical protein
MVDLAAAAASRAGLTNVATRVMDAQRLEVEAESFDAVISVWPHADPRLPQGVDGDPTSVCEAVGRSAQWCSRPRTISVSVDSSLNRPPRRSLALSPEPFGEFRLSAPGVLADAYRRAGFYDVAVHPVPTKRTFPSAAAAVEYTKALPVRELMARLGERSSGDIFAARARPPSCWTPGRGGGSAGCGEGGGR